MNFQLNDITFKLSMTSLSQGYWVFRYKRVNEEEKTIRSQLTGRVC